MVHTEHVFFPPRWSRRSARSGLGQTGACLAGACLAGFWLIACCLACLLWSSQALASRPAAAPTSPRGDAAAYLLMDVDSGRLLVARNIDEPRQPASLTKMMTVYVAGEEIKAGRLDLNAEVIVGEKAWRMKGSRMFLELGSSVSVAQLLHGIIIQSGNDACVALAEYIAGSVPAFVTMMNQAAHDLGMTKTRFVNPTGLPDTRMYSTARDLALLSVALIRDHPDLYRLHRLKEYAHNDIKQYNRNRLLHRDASVDGIKTGYTRAAGYCQTTSALRGGMRLVSVVLGAKNISVRTRLSRDLLEYGFAHFETRLVFAAKRPLGHVRIWKTDTSELSYGPPHDVHVTLARGRFEHVEQELSLSLSDPVVGPVPRGQPVGTVRLFLDSDVLARTDVVVLSANQAAGFLGRMVDSVRLLFARNDEKVADNDFLGTVIDTMRVFFLRQGWLSGGFPGEEGGVPLG
jgi:serine-type D-Ala-D-Ala carboxypeptidase (penicillin-binding protein 5/6)